MEDIRIVEYEPSWAKAVADMWNKSSEGWNGSITSKTEDSVLREHENASHLNVFLAVKGDEVIGYCSFDEYFMDEGALFINLLNVRPDYHGKKIGKMLVLNAVKKTIELGWPRLDLFTWPGNTKAVPLYKKCGFFWEKRDDTTHLMNFIPTLLNTEALREFFETADWYEDSTRTIEVKPDGRQENKFDYFEYSWEKDGRKLRVEFERTGRGMRLIETDDYLVSATVEDHELIFGRDYKVVYEIVNKSGKPLNVAIKGRSDKNITFDLDCSVDVTERKTIEAYSHVGEVKEEQNPHRTHPGVVADLLINGKKAVFKVGIVPVYPAKMDLYIPGQECYLGVRSECYMEIENKFKEDAVFTFTLPEMKGITFEEKSSSVELKGGGRTTVTIPYILDSFIYYSASMRVNACLASGETVSFQKDMSIAFKGRSGILWGENRNGYEIFNGPYSAGLNKNNNSVWMSRISGDNHSSYWLYPKVGKPFSVELYRKKPDHVAFETEDGKVILRAVYNLDDFKGLQLTIVTKLDSSGIVEHYYQLKNTTDSQIAEDVWISDTFRHDMFRGVMPYEGGFVEFDDTDEVLLSQWNSEKITENWLFSYGENMTRGVCWDPNDAVKFDNYCMYFEHNLGKLPAGETVSTKPVIVALGVFGSWQDFRTFALKKARTERLVTARYADLVVNGGNPFVTGDFVVAARDLRNSGLSGKISIASCSGSFECQTKKLSASDGVREATFKLNSEWKANPDILRLSLDADAVRSERKAAVFCKSGGKIEMGQTIEAQKDVLWADNGSVRIKVSPGFSHALFSLESKGMEWLDSSFPSPGIKAWWNPWIGGVVPSIPGMSESTVLEEARSAGFVRLCDESGNTWEGIRTVLTVEKNEMLKGMKLGFYYLMLPGAPVVCCVTGIVQETGRYLGWHRCDYECFFKPGENINESYVEIENSKKEKIRLRPGVEQHFVETKSTIMYGSDRGEKKLLLYADPDNMEVETGVNSKLVMAFIGTSKPLRSGEKGFTHPFFLILADEYIPSELLKDLRNVKFGKDQLDI